MKETTDYSGWLRSAATFLLLSGSMLGFHCNQLSVQSDHWKIERARTDSVNAALQAEMSEDLDSLLRKK